MRNSQLSLFVLVACCIFSQIGFSQEPALPLGNGRLPDARTPRKPMLPMVPRKEDKLDREAEKEAEKEAKEAEKRLAELRRVDPVDIDTYRSLLKDKHTGIFKLFPNMDCFSKTVIRIDGGCAGIVPDTSDYSFLKRDYEIKYHDIGFFKDEIVSHGFFSQGVLVSLKDTPIEDVKPERDELMYLSNLKTSISFEEAKKAALAFDEGIIDNGNRYASHISAAENTTYGLRLIAYHVPDQALFSNPARTWVAANRFFEELPRADLMVVFRVIRRDQDGVLLIVWKELNRQKAPKIKFAKGEEVVDFRTEQK